MSDPHVRIAGTLIQGGDPVRNPPSRLVFIVRLWREGDASTSKRPSWRGCVTRVPGGERFYARKPDDMPALVASQIHESGIPLGWYWHLRIRLDAWKRRRKQHR
jgi:hypothetical protein